MHLWLVSTSHSRTSLDRSFLRLCGLLLVRIVAQRVGPQSLDGLCKVFRLLGELLSHCRGHVHHSQPVRFKTDGFQQIARVLNPALGVDITLQVMTVAGQSTCHHRAIDAVFEGAQQVDDVHASAARNFDDAQRGRILNAQASGQIGGVIGAMGAAEGHDMWLKFRHRSFLWHPSALQVLR
jgi:hypothetical protein